MIFINSCAQIITMSILTLKQFSLVRTQNRAVSLYVHSPICKKNFQTHRSTKVVGFETNVSEMLIHSLYKIKKTTHYDETSIRHLPVS